MNKDNAKDYLPLVQAMVDGKVIQHRFGDEPWYDREQFDFTDRPDSYRIKPEPREHWSNRYADGYETAACFLSKSQAENAAYSKNVKQVRYREVIE